MTTDWSGLRDLLAAVRRRSWVAGLVVAAVALLALARYAGPGAAARHRYVAAQPLTVEALPPDGGGSFARAAAEQDAAALARALASPALAGAPAFDRAVVAALAAERAPVTARFGARAAGALGHLGATDVAAELTTARDGDGVVVTARSPDAATAWALASAAGAALASRPELAPGALVAPADGASLRVVAAGPTSSPTLDPALEAAARLRLLETLLLGVFGGIGLALAFDVWAARGAEGWRLKPRLRAWRPRVGADGVRPPPARTTQT